MSPLLYVLGVPLFQFHKVRLKAYVVLKYSPAVFAFQFHKVRLKERENDMGFLDNGFQFHKVRLKERRIRHTQRKTTVSIP